MKKIKILFALLLIVAAFNFAKVIYYFTALNFLDELLNGDTQEHFLVIVYVLTLIIFLAAHIYLCLGIWKIIKDGYFNQSSIRAFNRSGILLIAFGIITLFWRIYTVIDTAAVYGDLMPHGIVQAVENGYTIILGFGLMTITHIFQNGLHIKSENDLTI